jgi:hypothetical protein
MNALVLATAHIISFLGKCQSTLHSYRLLRAELAGKPLGASPEIVGVAHHKW